jgi:NAD(P)-dependent dehydrogenase (short-subunit alcohol dehydrogenase family)
METNCYGALRVIQALLPLLRRSPRGRIINISSGMGQLADMWGGDAAYRLSKTCLNALTATLAYDLRDTSIAVNCMCPGWVRTAMGGDQAPRSVEQGADTAVWLALDAPDDLRGKFLRDRKVIPW